MAESSHKRIVITGATRGLGRALGEGFARLGHAVIGCGRDAGAIEVLRAALGAPHDFEAVDVAREDRVKTWARRFLAASGAPDLLINNAALINRNAPTWEVPAEEFDRLIDVNIKGVANVLRHVVPAMIARESGVIWPRNSRRAWPPSPSTRASSTPRCSAAPSARRPATT
jgi:NAD(P)-dependent dehydrogenase (short-subunit alcohol dehydrogenase family)